MDAREVRARSIQTLDESKCDRVAADRDDDWEIARRAHRALSHRTGDCIQ